MKKVSTLSKYTLIGVFLAFCSVAVAQDFNIQEVQTNVLNSGLAGASGYAEVTNTGFTAVSSTNSAFALPSSNRKTHGGGSSAGREGDDMAGATVLTSANTITYYRETGSQLETTRFNTTIWEYTGPGGGANEFIVRGRYAVDLNGGNYTVNQLISGISNKDNCIPFITGIMNDSATDNADSGTAIAYLTSNTNLRVQKGGTNTPNVRVYITLVEFTGSNWTVLHGDSGAVGSANSFGDTGTITLNDNSDGSSGTDTDVSSWSNSMIFTHFRGDTATSGINDAHGDLWPSTKPGSDDRSIDWTFFSNHDSDGTNRHFVHVLNNSNVAVTWVSDATVGNTTVDISSAGLTDLSQSMIVGSTFHSGTGAGYGRGWRNYKINSLIQAEFYSARVGGGGATVGNELQIIDFATTPPTDTQGPGGITADIPLWLKANEGVEDAPAVNADNLDPVLNWLDNSVNNNDATQATSGNRPIFIDNAINFNPAVDFNGTLHEMAATIDPNSTMTIFAVAEGTGIIGSKNLLNLDGGISGHLKIEQTTLTNLRSRYNDGTLNSGEINTTVTNTIPFLANYDFVAGSNSELFDNGVSQGTDATNAYTLPASVTASIGADPSSGLTRWDGGISEIVIYNQALTATERNKVESYLAIKYGITLGTNGSSQDYIDSDGTVIWDQAANSTFDYNVTGLGRDDASELNQKQSKTINTANDITIGIKDIAASNSVNTTPFFADKTFLMWGNDNGSTAAAADITKDFSSGTGVTSSVSATPITRKWKFVVSNDQIPTIKLSIPKTMVISTNLTGLKDYIMIIADDAAFTTNVTSATMEDTGLNLEVDFYIEGTKYITFGSTDEYAAGDRAATFDRTDKYISAGDVNDLDNTDYTISAWVKRTSVAGKFDVVSKRNYFNENTDLEPGPDVQGTYTHGYGFRINNSNQFRMVWRDPSDTQNQIMETNETIPLNEWHHIAATHDFSENMTILYIDGIHVYDSDDFFADKGFAHDPMNVPSDAHFMIGAAEHKRRQQKLGGSVDEVRVWDVALSGDQLRYIMNQEIEQNGIFADGKVLPSNTTKNEIVTIPWNNLIAYYPMDTMVFGSVKDESNSGNDASMINYDLLDEETAPLPYKSTQNGSWDDNNTWENGDVQYLPGVVSYLYASELDADKETMDYNIVQIDHNVTLDNSTTNIPTYKNGNRTVLGLDVSGSGDLQIDGNTLANTGYALTVSHYLNLDGTIDLEGESQLIQTTDSDLDPTSNGTLERDQQGNANAYLYNYWSSPVGFSNNTTNNNAYTLPDIFNNIGYASGTYNGTTSPLEVAEYWIWKYANRIGNTYSEWQHVRNIGSISTGEGFTMKGVDVGASIAIKQNYIFQGKPNNGDFSLLMAPGNEYLVGNPYPSAMDADEFIRDNISATDGGKAGNLTNVINGALYFWDHFANNTHKFAEYEGGYATYTLMGGAVAISNDAMLNASGQVGTKVPERYIPVGQGFFVSSIADASLVGEPNDPGMTQLIIGGNILFKNSQRVFVKEGASQSLFLKNGSKKTSNANNPNVDTRQKIRLMYDSPDGYHRQLLVGIDEHASNSFDLGYDALLAETNKEDMYWQFNNANFIIQAVNNFNEEQILPLGVKTEKEGLATIKIDALENIDDDTTIYLHDKELDIYHDLKQGNYEVYLLVGEHLNRFNITFSEASASLGVDDFENITLEVYFSNEKESIIIHNPDSKFIESTSLYNILGQSVYEFKNKTSDNYFEHKTKNITAGIYIIKMKTDKGVLSKKILIK